jgi:UDP:flavonoid glycosyltransferase YjiC (YdhE family)
VRRLGVGERLLVGEYTPASVAQVLDRLTTDRALQARCTEVAGLCRAEGDAIPATCDAVLRLCRIAPAGA